MVRSALTIAIMLAPMTALAQPVSTRDVPLLTIAGKQYRDLNRNGRLDPYEDWRLSAERRADDLIARMTLAEKAG